MAGNYRQCVPNPSNETQFILIQPEVTEDDTANYTIGKLENPRREKYMSYDNEEDLKIYPTQEEEKEHENKKFSVISYWDFSATTNRTFDCTHSFTTDSVMSFDFSNSGNKTYLFQSRRFNDSNGKVFFFC